MTMGRIEVNVLTGKAELIPLTAEEIAAIAATPVPEPPPAPEVSIAQVRAMLATLGLTAEQTDNFLAAAAQI